MNNYALVKPEDLKRKPDKTVVAVSIGEFLQMEIPPREFILEPVLTTQSLTMLFASRGVGKTHVALGIAYAVASGGAFLKWQAPKPKRVLYLDGEMPAGTMQSRMAEMVQRSETEPPSPDFLRLVTPDLQDGPMPDISTEKGQATIDPLIDGVELVIVDNLSTLVRSGKENESEGWLPVQGWALDLRRRGISVVFVHHAAKSGVQRGTSKREDVLDTIVRLEHPHDYRPDQGACFEVHYDKGRHLFGADARPFEATLGATGWTFRDIEDANLSRVVDLTIEGLTVRDIADETGISKSRVNRLQKKAKAEGMLS
jgi:putative DNA primase/helicase